MSSIHEHPVIRFSSVLRQYDCWWKRSPGSILLFPYFPWSVPLDLSGGTVEEAAGFRNAADESLDRFQRTVRRQRHCDASYPTVSASLGVGSIAAFLGSPVSFTGGSVWFHPRFPSLEETVIDLSLGADWLQWSLDFTRRAVDASGGSYIVSIPDLGSAVDILTSLVGPQELMLGMIDTPDLVHSLLEQIHTAWIEVYERHYEIVSSESGFSAATLEILGWGRTCNVQCDFSAMISEEMFAEFVVPTVTAQAAFVDNAMYHIDGPDALRHVDMILRMEDVAAIQWSPGSGNPGCEDPQWDAPLYHKVLSSGKALQIFVDAENVAKTAERLGCRGIMILFWVDELEEAEQVIETVDLLHH